MRRAGLQVSASQRERRDNGPRRRRGTATALASAGLICSLLGGCALFRVAEDGLGYEERRTRLVATPGWRMSGRIAVNNGAQAFQGRFRWRQDDDEVELSVSNPLGMNVLHVSGPLEKLTVRSGGKTWELADPEPELSALLGWWVPVKSLHAWLLGYPDPDYSSEQRLGPARAVLLSLQQRSWSLTYESYQLHHDLLVPRRIDLAHGALELRVIVDGWQPSS